MKFLFLCVFSFSALSAMQSKKDLSVSNSLQISSLQSMSTPVERIGLSMSNSIFTTIHLNDFEAFKQLWIHAYAVDTRDWLGRTALMLAAQYGCSKFVGILLKDEKCMLDPTKKTALMYAAMYGHTACVRLLVFFKEAGFRDQNNFTALMYAASRGHTEVVRVLAPLENKVQLFEKETGLSVSSCICNVNYLSSSLKKQWRNDMFSKTALMCAAEEGYVDIVKILCKYELGCTHIEHKAYTALMYAASRGHAACVQAICDASLQTIDSTGIAKVVISEIGMQHATNLRTALMYAAINGHFDVIRILYQYEYDRKDAKGLDVMYYASFYDAEHGGDDCEQCVRECRTALLCRRSQQ